MSCKHSETLDRLSAFHWCTAGGPAAANRRWRATQNKLADRRHFQIGRVADGVPPEVRPCQAADFVPPKKRWWTARSLLAGETYFTICVKGHNKV